MDTLNEKYRVPHDDGRLFGIYARAIVRGYLSAITAGRNGSPVMYAQPGAMPPDIRLDSDLRTRFMEILINRSEYGIGGDYRAGEDFVMFVTRDVAWFGQETGKVRPDPEASLLVYAYGFYVAVAWVNMPSFLDANPCYIEAFARSYMASQLSAFGVTVRLPATLPPWKGRPN